MLGIRLAPSATLIAFMAIPRFSPVAYRAAHSHAIPNTGEAFNRASSSYSQHASKQETSDPRKGKQRQDPLAESYRFPAKGKSGGAPDPFEVMALDRDATPQDVKKRYYQLALILHPDSSHPSSSPDHFATLNKAYKLLSSSTSRSSFLRTGYGWDVSNHSMVKDSSDAAMYAEILRRKRGGAAAWDNNSRGYRNSDAGRGAWGGFDGSKGWRPYEDINAGFRTPNTDNNVKEERYMSNNNFLIVLCIVTAAVAWFQFNRLGYAADSHREMLDKQHFEEVQVMQELEMAEKEAAKGQLVPITNGPEHP
ncbi:hypothetical protein IAT38_006270 [Cryptococcus sp. DSM 104549]